ncbi:MULTISPECIES: hypothetical protein [unclassified Streptomyces]|uniref:hypothetical protein n=1 Tax=unclassified Streptomyces TaxID=2593676 RepID=UPI002E197074|nr:MULTISPECIES: hypothetical protein [unclassified Streptomyces]
MTTEQLALVEPDLGLDDEEYDDAPDEPSLPADLRGQHIPPGAHITDIHLTGSYL